jgi:hypothetical protein
MKTKTAPTPALPAEAKGSKQRPPEQNLKASRFQKKKTFEHRSGTDSTKEDK